ncbi:MAG: hypothetical protein MH137_01480 [Flavobacteriales bacterium]|nr:hypothetical protein [Flavobacteriales bacterium]
MKSLVLFICSAALLLNVSAQKPMTYKMLVPKSMKKYKFGMSHDAFTKKNKNVQKSDFSFRHEYDIESPSQEVKMLILYFDTQGEQPLYELIIDYHNPAVRDAFVEKNYGKPNDGKQWKWKLPDGLTAKAWTFMNKLVITVLYPGTEHAE